MDKPRLLYFVDAMCSWCHGFAPQMEQVKAHFADDLDHLTFSGGLRPFTKEPMDPEKQAALGAVYDRISELSGQSFAKPKSMDEGFVYDTEPASRAIVTMRHLAPGRDYPFMLSIQRAFYTEGADITVPHVLASHAERFGVTPDAFLPAFESAGMREATLEDFRVAQQFQIDGFPTLILHKKGMDGQNKLMIVGKGYCAADELIERIETAMSFDG